MKLIWIDRLQGELRTDFWLGFSDLYCDFLGFICSYFDLILLALVPLLVGFSWLDRFLIPGGALAVFYQHLILFGPTC